MRRGLLISAALCVLLPTWAQAQTSVVTAGGATQWAPVIVIPASAVNGAGVSTVALSAPSISLGTTPATTGTVALPTAGTINFRNNANSADVAVLATNASDEIVMCGSNCGGIVPATTNVRDIGATAATWRTGYFGTSMKVSAGLTLATTADKLTQINDNANATGLELNVGTPTLGTCTAGALTSGSHNFAGQYTSNTSGSCVINFGAPNFTNTPFCFAMSMTSTTHPRISAASASSITVTGGVSGETIQYFCVGRIGT